MYLVGSSTFLLLFNPLLENTSIIYTKNILDSNTYLNFNIYRDEKKVILVLLLTLSTTFCFGQKYEWSGWVRMSCFEGIWMRSKKRILIKDSISGGGMYNFKIDIIKE